MDQITVEELRVFSPRALIEYLEAISNGWRELQEAQINTPLRVCEFLAQTAHETGGFTIKAENLNYSAKRMAEVWPTRFRGAWDPKALACANNPEKLGDVVYGKRLGNIDPGDGYLYRGRGFFQDTGRDCYREFGAMLGIDLEANPELLEQPSLSLKAALIRWQQHDLNRFADRHYIRAIGNALNRGNPYSRYEPIGAKSREQWFARAWALFGTGQLQLPPDLALGAYGGKVEMVQNRLRELGYPVGAVDKVFGPTLARSVAAFKLDYKRRHGVELEPDERIGELTQRALDGADPIELSPERQQASEHDLVAAGSREVTAGREATIAGTGAVAVGSAEGLRQSGLLEQAETTFGWLPAAKTAIVPVIDAVQWGLRNFIWVLVIVGGFWFWTKGRQIIAARLDAHRSGANLGR